MPIRLRYFGSGENLVAKTCEKTPNNFLMVATLVGRVDPERMRAALREAAAQFPILSASVRSHRGRHGFAFGDGRIPELQLIARRGPKHWQDVGMEQVNSRIALTEESLWTATLLTPDHTESRAEVEASELLLNFNHALGDGMSGVNLVRQILAIYSGAPAAVTFAAPVPEKIYHRHLPRGQRLRNLAANSAALVASSRRKATRFKAGPNATPGDYGHTCLAAHTLGASAHAGLVAACRKHGATVHGALCAAMLMATHAEAAHGPLTLGVTSAVNLRPHLGGDSFQREFGFLTASIDTLCRVDANTDFWALAAHISGDVRIQVARGAPRLTILLTKLLVKTSANYDILVKRIRSIANSTVLVTNLGRLAIPTVYGDLRLTGCFHIPSAQFTGQAIVALAAVSLDEILRLNFVYPTPFTDAAAAERVIAATLAKLSSLAET